jgi:hypothetical protein
MTYIFLRDLDTKQLMFASGDVSLSCKKHRCHKLIAGAVDAVVQSQWLVAANTVVALLIVHQ